MNIASFFTDTNTDQRAVTQPISGVNQEEVGGGIDNWKKGWREMDRWMPGWVRMLGDDQTD